MTSPFANLKLDPNFSTSPAINELFRIPASRRDPALLRRLLDCIKQMVIAKHKSLELGFNQFADKG